MKSAPAFRCALGLVGANPAVAGVRFEDAEDVGLVVSFVVDDKHGIAEARVARPVGDRASSPGGCPLAREARQSPP